jgi:pimeloyl-ACP methyl ester carboxylesterase
LDLSEIRNELKRRADAPPPEPPRKRGIGRVLAWLLVTVIALVVLIPIGFRVAASLREVHTAADLAPSTGQFVTTRHGRIHLQQVGPTDAPPVVLIHGTAAWSGLWRATMERLAAHNLRVIAIDVPPFGFSDRPEPPDYSRAAQADRIADTLTALGIDRAILVGHSFGAGPTVETVLRHPQKVRGLVLVAGALAISDGGASDPTGPLAWVLDQPWLRDKLVATTATNPFLTRTLLATMLHRKERATAEIAAILQVPMTLRNSTHDLGGWLKSFLSPDRTALSADRGRYAEIKVPTRLIWGDQDTLTPLSQGHDIQGLIAGSGIVVMPGIGHIPQVEDPENFAKILADALAGMVAR